MTAKEVARTLQSLAPKDSGESSLVSDELLSFLLAKGFVEILPLEQEPFLEHVPTTTSWADQPDRLYWEEARREIVSATISGSAFGSFCAGLRQQVFECDEQAGSL
jgi:hypothetical protein